MESQFIWQFIGVLTIAGIASTIFTWIVCKTIYDLRGDIRVLNMRMDSGEKHEFLRRKPTTEGEK